MAEHSEAPWRFDAAPSDAGSTALRGHILPHDTTTIDDPAVAFIEGVGSVDLSLILAAPDLLAGALEMRCWGCSTFVYLDKLPGAGRCDLCDPIRAAIAKAKGQQP